MTRRARVIRYVALAGYLMWATGATIGAWDWCGEHGYQGAGRVGASFVIGFGAAPVVFFVVGPVYTIIKSGYDNARINGQPA